MNEIPIIDLSALVDGSDPVSVADQIGRSCRESGFFYIIGHGIDDSLCSRLDRLSREFFSWDVERKLDIRMEKGGLAWRGYFPVGSELTSGKPDQKEGLYFGSELDGSHPKVAAKVPLHGRNQFPDLAGFRATVLDYLDAMTQLGHQLMVGLAISLGLDRDYFRRELTFDPLILFRIFHYPALVSSSGEQWSVGEHTDYGLLTILRQDNAGGLQVKSQSRWVDAPPVANSFVCNIGDMLDRMTGGVYRSTPHRVRNPGSTGRVSFPFFFDPSFDAQIRPIRTPDSATAATDRWDRENVHEFEGTYGDYILKKVARVFPKLARQVDSD